MEGDTAELTTTSYALLSLLALRPWTTYELAQQMARSLHWFWPRAESKLYQEPKKLAARGLAHADRRYNGRRPSTVYTITAAGRRALTAWVRAPGSPSPVLEFEALLRVFAAQMVGADDLRRILDSVRREMEAWEAFGEGQGEEIATTGGPFPDRTHVIMLVHGFMDLYVDAVHRWALWALEEVRGWTDTAPDDEKLRRARQFLLTPIAEIGVTAGNRVATARHSRPRGAVRPRG